MQYNVKYGHPSDQKALVLGFGVSGQACVRYLHRHGYHVQVIDDCAHAQDLVTWAGFDRLEWRQSLDIAWAQAAEVVIASPGFAPHHPIVESLVDLGIDIVSDLDGLIEAAQAPVIVVTGTNGKSTVVTQLAHVLEAQGLQVGLGGNLGVPAYDLLQGPIPDYYVIEASSYQLARLQTPKIAWGVLLNLTPDHLAWHGSFKAYAAAKYRLFELASNTVICDRSWPWQASWPPSRGQRRLCGCAPQSQLTWQDDRRMIAYQGQDLITMIQFQRPKHEFEHAMVVLTLIEALNLDVQLAARTLLRWQGMSHRCESIGVCDQGIEWVNDSKATNVAASLKCLAHWREQMRPLIVLFGGIQKQGDDYARLFKTSQQISRLVILYGQDAPILNQFIGKEVGLAPVIVTTTLEAAMQLARQHGIANDVVCLSPACASFDQFSDFSARGDAFIAQFKEWQ